MERLNKYIADHPDAAYAWFLRGYHYDFLGYKDAAKRDLSNALRLERRDELTKFLLKRLEGNVRSEAEKPVPALPVDDSPLSDHRFLSGDPELDANSAE